VVKKGPLFERWWSWLDDEDVVEVVVAAVVV
jgi:hypothetical protein